MLFVSIGRIYLFIIYFVCCSSLLGDLFCGCFSLFFIYLLVVLFLFLFKSSDAVISSQLWVQKVGLLILLNFLFSLLFLWGEGHA